MAQYVSLHIILRSLFGLLWTGKFYIYLHLCQITTSKVWNILNLNGAKSVRNPQNTVWHGYKFQNCSPIYTICYDIEYTANKLFDQPQMLRTSFYNAARCSTGQISRTWQNYYMALHSETRGNLLFCSELVINKQISSNPFKHYTWSESFFSTGSHFVYLGGVYMAHMGIFRITFVYLVCSFNCVPFGAICRRWFDE